MRILVALAGAVALAGCALSMDHPSKTLAEQQLDRQHCRAEAKSGAKVSECMAAMGYVAQAFPFEE